MTKSISRRTHVPLCQQDFFRATPSACDRCLDSSIFVEIVACKSVLARPACTSTRNLKPMMTAPDLAKVGNNPHFGGAGQAMTDKIDVAARHADGPRRSSATVELAPDPERRCSAS